MFTPKPGLFERIDQSLKLLGSHFLLVTGGLWAYSIVFTLIGGGIVKYLTLGWLSTQITPEMSWENLLSLTYTTEFMIFLTVLAIAWILYLFGYIIFILAIYRILSQITRDTTSSISASLVYGATHLSKSFATYWYIFAYVALIPALLFALGGILINLGYFGILPQSPYISIGTILMVIGGVIGIVFLIYRGTRAKFAIPGAVDTDTYSKASFQDTLQATQYNFWRIIGNYIFIGIVISLVSSLVNTVIGIFSFLAEPSLGLMELITNGANSITPYDILPHIGSISIAGIATGVLKISANTIFIVFGFVFTYIFYRALSEESTQKKETSVQESPKVQREL